MFEDVNRLNVSRGQLRIIIPLEFREFILIIEFYLNAASLES